MKIFDVTSDIRIVCNSSNTRNGFKHEAILLLGGDEMGVAKINYTNRTWEAYEFQSLLKKVAEEFQGPLGAHGYAMLIEYAEGYEPGPDPLLHATAMAMAVGGVLTDDQQSANDWKARMLKAGLEHHGLIMPDDWNELSEDEKTSRLDKVIEHLRS